MKHRPPCIARLLKESRARDPRSTDVVLFFPHEPANEGHLMSWQLLGEHGEATVAFLHSATVPPHDENDTRVIESACAEYIRVNPDFPFTLVQKLPKGWEAKAWRKT